YVYVNALLSPTPGPISDTTKYKPILQLSIIDSNTVDAGKATEIRVQIQNLSSMYSAYNIILQGKMGADSTFTSVLFTSIGAIPEIKYGTSLEVKITVNTDKYAVGGISLLPISLSFTNIWNDEFSLDAAFALSIVNPGTPGLITLINANTNPENINAGSNFDIAFSVTNKGTFPAKDIRITLEGLSLDTFMLATGSNRIVFKNLNGGRISVVVMKLRAGVGMKSGSHPLNFKIEYTDERANKTTDEQQIWIPVNEVGSSAANIEFTSITPSKVKLNPGDAVTVNVILKNNGTAEARQVKVLAEVPAASLYPVLQDTYIIQLMKPDESKTLTFSFQAQETAPRGSTPITIRVEAPDGKGGITNIAQAASIFQNGSVSPEDPAKNIPRIIVKSYSTDPSVVKAGEKFKLSLEFLNTNQSKTIYNIKASFTVTESSSETGNVFTPVDSSNTFYIDNIAPKEAVQKDINLYTIPDAKSKTYTVTISFEYQDKAGNPFNSNELIGIPVYQPARFEISEPNFPPETQLGQPVFVNFEMYNLGKNTLYNVKLRIEGVESQPKSTYYGNFEAGHNEYVELNITPMVVGDAIGKIIVSYEASSGEVNETVKEFTMKVAEMSQVEPGKGEVTGPDGKPIPGNGDGSGEVIGPDGKPITDGSTNAGFFQSTLFKVIAGVVLLGISAAIVTFIMRKRNKEKGIEFQ
ncbi:MAG: hypothetical protein Q7J78_06030, partial [Clostridiales bacterium]|nr:hypothetical protein [Clostridiales bacterium]